MLAAPALGKPEAALQQGCRIKITLVSHSDSRVEYATRVLFPATRRKHCVACKKTHRTSKFVRSQI